MRQFAVVFGVLLGSIKGSTQTTWSRQASPNMCPRNLDVFWDEGRPKSCVPTNVSSCPNGFFCNEYFDVRRDEHAFICCGKEPGYCENGVAYINNATNEGVECTVDLEGECSPPFACRSRISGSKRGFCCRDLEAIEPPPVGCPWGTRPILVTGGGGILNCTPGRPNACPEGGVCYYDSVDGSNKCCGKDPGEGCPSGTKPQRGPGSQPLSCRPGVPTQGCAGLGMCQWSYLIDRYQCCEPDSGCPEGLIALMDPSNKATPCQRGITNSCPASYSCEYNFWTSSYQCCGRNAGICPVGQVAYMNPATNLEQSCPGGAPQCPAGYSCQPSTTGTQICCGTAGQCPQGLVYATDATNRPVGCSPNVANSCAFPAICQPAVGGMPAQYLCCRSPIQGGVSGTTVQTCASGRSPFIPSGTTNPQICQVGSSIATLQCPGTYSCEPSNVPSVTICCSLLTNFPAQYMCPDNSFPYAPGGQTQFCSPSFPSTCPSTHICQQAPNVAGQFVCCLPSGSGDPMCPSGLQVLRVRGIAVQYCAPGNQAQCSVEPGYNCLASTNIANVHVCCGFAGSAQILCSGNLSPFTQGGSTKFCNPALGDCPALSHTCQQAINRSGVFVCCPTATPTATYVCPAGGTLNSQVITCTPNIIGSCPANFACAPAVGMTGINICCNFQSTASLCPNNQETLQINGVVQYCTGSTAICPSSLFSCQYSALANVFLCCRTSFNVVSVTPACANGQPVHNPYNVAFYCNPAIQQCPANYACLASVESGRFVCCLQQVTNLQNLQCPGKRVVYITSQGQPLTCSTTTSLAGCPANTQCELAIGGFSGVPTYICCHADTTQQTTAQCPVGWIVDNPLSPTTCHPLTNPVCRPSIYSCVQAQNTIATYICCVSQSLVTNLRCASGQQHESWWNGTPRICDPTIASIQASSQCTTGYSCLASTQTNIFLCCTGSSITGNTANVCADGTQAEMTSFGGTPSLRYCSLNTICSSGYSCKLLAGSTLTACCLTTPGTISSVCFDGTMAATAASGVGLRYCNQGSFSECPSGYHCKLLSGSTAFACCLATGSISNFVCIDNTQAAMAGTNVRYCNRFTPVCDLGYNCKQLIGSDMWACCRSNVPIQTRCQNGNIPHTVNGEIVPCSMGVPNQCPISFSCMQASGTPFNLPVHVCCPVSLADAICSNGGQLLNRALTCVSNADCGSGYACDRNTDGTLRCCSSTGVITGSQYTCLNGQPAAMEGQTPRTCNLYSPNCPSTFVCQQSSSGHQVYYCCQGPICPTGFTIFQSNGQPRYCQPNSVGDIFGCLPGTTCLEAANVRGNYICCQSTTGAAPTGIRCLNNRAVLLTNNEVTYCPVASICPRNYECTSSTTTGQFLCCSILAQDSAQVCPLGSDPYLDRQNQYLYCTNTNFACPDGYRCNRAVNDPVQYVCCKQRPTCQRGWLPILEIETSEPKSCSPTVANSCTPPGEPYKCQLSTVPGRYLCCVESLIQWESEAASSGDSSNDKRTFTEIDAGPPLPLLEGKRFISNMTTFSIDPPKVKPVKIIHTEQSKPAEKSNGSETSKAGKSVSVTDQRESVKPQIEQQNPRSTTASSTTVVVSTLATGLVKDPEVSKRMPLWWEELLAQLRRSSDGYEASEWN